MVSLITRRPANPIIAPFSAIITSPRLAIEACTPAVVGYVITEINGRRCSESRARTTDVFAICISDKIPSWIRAPPDEETRINGHWLRIASSIP